MARPTGIAVASIVEILLGIFALIVGVLHLLFGVGGLVTLSGTDVCRKEGLGVCSVHQVRLRSLRINNRGSIQF